MAIFRSPRKRDYTVMSNHHLRNRGLSLKAKGLHSLMLSLPEDWDFTQRGLAAICKDGVDSIASALHELEASGYLSRRRIRDALGRLIEIEYTILECPDSQLQEDSPAEGISSPDMPSPEWDKPLLENPTPLCPSPESGNPLPDITPLDLPSPELEKPLLEIPMLETPSPEWEKPVQENPSPKLEKPVQENPTQEIPAQGNTAQLNIQEINTQELSTHQSIIHSDHPLQEKSPRPPAVHESPRRNDRKTDLLPRSMEIRNRIEYDYLITQYDQVQVDEIVELMLEVELNQSPTMKLGREGEFPTEFIRQRFAKLNESHIELVLDNLAANTTRVHNTRAYILTALFNSISTIDSHYALLVNFDQSHR